MNDNHSFIILAEIAGENVTVVVRDMPADALTQKQISIASVNIVSVSHKNAWQVVDRKLLVVGTRETFTYRCWTLPALCVELLPEQI